MKTLLLITLLATSQAYAELGTVMQITDGDTIKVQTVTQTQTQGQTQTKKLDVRFHCTDTPESVMVGKQKAQIVNGLNYGTMATDYLKTLIKVGDTVEVNCNKLDQWNRDVCVIIKDGLNINLQMIKGGYAVVLKEYCPKRQNLEYYNTLENAKNTKVGLWATGEIPYPQTFRNCVKYKQKPDCNA
jgi:endonuclease YncB( thermonuclease family)